MAWFAALETKTVFKSNYCFCAIPAVMAFAAAIDTNNVTLPPRRGAGTIPFADAAALAFALALPGLALPLANLAATTYKSESLSLASQQPPLQ